MRYFSRDNGTLHLVNTESMPDDLEALYQSIREKYTIYYSLSDWADDDSDAGWGYCYSNSYSFYREPHREEMIVENGKLAGFYVGSVEAEPSSKHVLPLEHDARVHVGGSYSPHYDDSKTWVLKIEENPAPAGYVYLIYVPHDTKDQQFTPADFSEELVEAVVKQYFVEDTRGGFNGASRFKLKLTPAAMEQPDRVLSCFAEYHPVLVRH